MIIKEENQRGRFILEQCKKTSSADTFGIFRAHFYALEAQRELTGKPNSSPSFPSFCFIYVI